MLTVSCYFSLKKSVGIVGWETTGTSGTIVCLLLLRSCKFMLVTTPMHLFRKLCKMAKYFLCIPYLCSDEVRGEILFVLYRLSLLQASPWDDDYCNLYDDDLCGNYIADLSTIGELLLRRSLNVLLKTQSDDVRLNCIGMH
jgi:hypothetical protein